MNNKATAMASKLVSKPKLIYVEGNIGSGKSTLMDLCRSRENLEVIGEPVEKWQKFYTHNFLKYKYQDKRPEIQLMFQLMVNLTRLDQLNEARPTEKTIMMEKVNSVGVPDLYQNSVNKRRDKWTRDVHAPLHEQNLHRKDAGEFL